MPEALAGRRMGPTVGPGAAARIDRCEAEEYRRADGEVKTKPQDVVVALAVAPLDVAIERGWGRSTPGPRSRPGCRRSGGGVHRRVAGCARPRGRLSTAIIPNGRAVCGPPADLAARVRATPVLLGARRAGLMG